MNITIEQITDKLKALPEHALERVWGYVEALSENASGKDIPGWQQTIVAERLENYEQNPDSAVEIDEVFREIEKDF